MEKFVPHATLQTNWQERKCGKEEKSARDRDRRRELEKTLENTGSSEYKEKESNLRPGLFLCIRRRRMTFILDLC
jgi:hypothetical protein